MTEAPEITVATPADREQVMSTVVAAFRDDPVLRFLFPDDATYPSYAVEFFGRLFDKRVHRGSIWTIGGLSVAMWDPPADDAVDGEGGAVDAPPLADVLPAEVMERVDAYDRAVHDAFPAQPYWYLGVLATHPDHAGKRWGRAVMAEGQRRAAADGLPAVLETSSRGNVEIYRRAGFAVAGEVAEPVPTWVMKQDPVRG